MDASYSVFLKYLFSIILIHSLLSSPVFSQNTAQIPPPICEANGNSGFGGAVGLGAHFRGQESGGVIWFNFSNNGSFNDVFVIYISTGAPGRSILDSTVDDDLDSYRIAISNSNVYGYGSSIYFPEGFEVTHGVAIDTNFAGLWSIPSTGNVGSGELNYIGPVNSTLTSPTQNSYEIRFSYADIGLSVGSFFYYVGLYVRNDGYTSDEGYGDGIVPNTQGSDDVVFTSFKGFTNQANCNYVVLGENDIHQNSFELKYLDGDLIVKGINDFVSVKVFDITGRLILQKKIQIYDEASIQLGLKKKQLYFISVETLNSKKILKVIPH